MSGGRGCDKRGVMNLLEAVVAVYAFGFADLVVSLIWSSWSEAGGWVDSVS